MHSFKLSFGTTQYLNKSSISILKYNSPFLLNKYSYTTVSKEAVRELRELTSAPILKCHKVLLQCEGNIEKAQQVLREQSFHVRIRKSDDCMGKIILALTSPDNASVGLLEVFSETDFVIRNDLFLSFIEKLRVIGNNILSTDKFMNIDNDSSSLFNKLLTESILHEQRYIESVVKENIKYGNVYLYSVKSDNSDLITGYYAHNNSTICKSAGSIAAISIMKYDLTQTTIDKEELQILANEYAQHAVSQFGSNSSLKASSVLGSELNGEQWQSHHRLNVIKSISLSSNGEQKSE